MNTTYSTLYLSSFSSYPGPSSNFKEGLPEAGKGKLDVGDRAYFFVPNIFDPKYDLLMPVTVLRGYYPVTINGLPTLELEPAPYTGLSREELRKKYSLDTAEGKKELEEIRRQYNLPEVPGNDSSNPIHPLYRKFTAHFVKNKWRVDVTKLVEKKNETR